MAGDEDDDMFGDFKFVSYPTSTNQNNRKTVADDDDWGDFVTTPKQQDLQPSNGFSFTHHPTNTFVDPFNIVSDQPKLNHVESIKKLDNSPSRSWEKPRGALPLSIFGGDDEVEEEEEEAIKTDLDRSSDKTQSKPVKSERNIGSDVSLSDVIVSLYGQQQTQNGSVLNVDDKTVQIKNESGSNSNGKIENGSNSNSAESVDGDFGDDDEWEFKDAISENNNDFGTLVVQTETPAAATTMSTITTTKPAERNVQESSEGSPFDFGNNAQLNGDWFVAPEGNSYKHGIVDNGAHFESGMSTGNNAQLNGDWFVVSEGNSYSPTVGNNGAHSQPGLSTGNSAQLNGDWFVASEGNSYNATIINNRAHSESGLSTGNLWNPMSPSQPGQTQSVNNIYLVNGIDSDENFGNFKDTSPINKSSSSYFEQQHKQIASDRNNVHSDNGTIDLDESFGSFTDAPNTKASDSYSEQKQSKQIAPGHGDNIYIINEAFDSDESFGDFKDASPNTKALNVSFEQEELKIADQASLEIKERSTIGETQGNDKALENDRGALPLSLFGDENLDSEESLFGKDVFSFKPATSVRNGTNTQVSSSNISLNDLIFDLYSQAEKIPTVITTRDHAEDEYSSPQIGLNSTLENVEDDFDRSSWEFKTASEAEDKYSDPVVGVGSIHQTFPMESKIVSYIDFYSKLKEEAGFIILHHLDDLKNAQKLAALSGEEAKADTLHQEIQTAYKKLVQEKVVSEDADLMSQAARSINLNELLAATEEQKFLEFESEYRLSQRISLAEQNIMSAIELFEHAILVLKILKLGSEEDIFNYTSAWSRMISACAQELKHAASIWKQSLEENIHKQILSKPQGQEYILALGEIFRVAEVLRVSARIYKPWILSSLANPAAIFASLEECNSVWSSSGLDDALQGLSDTVDVKLNGSAKALVESINSIHGLRNLDLPYSENMEQTCAMSLLSLQVVPAMKMVIWDGEQYFLTLANFWANLVSRDPPRLSHTLVNS